jgi:hypothetical protein
VPAADVGCATMEVQFRAVAWQYEVGNASGIKPSRTVRRLDAQIGPLSRSITDFLDAAMLR